jgi:hypothetical protein
VVAVKQLHNQVVAVVLTSGYLYLISGKTEKAFARYDLLTNLDHREGRTPTSRILKAKLDFKKRDFSYGMHEPAL